MPLSTALFLVQNNSDGWEHWRRLLFVCVCKHVCARDWLYVCVHVPTTLQKNLPHLEYVIFLWRPVVGACILKRQGLSFPHYSNYLSPHPPPAWPLGLAPWHHPHLREMDHLFSIYLQLSDLLPEFCCWCCWCSSHTTTSRTSLYTLGFGESSWFNYRRGYGLSPSACRPVDLPDLYVCSPPLLVRLGGLADDGTNSIWELQMFFFPVFCWVPPSLPFSSSLSLSISLYMLLSHFLTAQWKITIILSQMLPHASAQPDKKKSQTAAFSWKQLFYFTAVPFRVAAPLITQTRPTLSLAFITKIQKHGLSCGWVRGGRHGEGREAKDWGQHRD